MGQTNGLIGFLGKNKTIELENTVLSIIRPLMEESTDLRREFRLYLPERILAKMQETPLQQPQAERPPIVEKGKLLRLQILLLLAFGIAPTLYLFRHWGNLAEWSSYAHLTQFVIDFNYYIAFYSIAVSSSYLILLVFSFKALIRQAKNWRLKKNVFLFRPRILPGISIIAPAYQEEASILESANSLLSLHYPNYEVIIVNDGSTDKTLQKLIQHFKLEKVDRYIPQRLQTKPIRGIYASRDIPKLIVIDKAQGGKADALNVGINTSQKEFFCGIDADSLLEKDSLIKLASMVVDSPHEPIAVGGNIFPVNGCTVDKGTLTKVNIPRSHLARFQTIEYLRAFMAGRLGWGQLRSLLIISGAFGLFNKDRVVEVGGYLTSSERYKKDTVGEDMELVVRLTRYMLEKKLPYSILYAFNANCWTEVPDSLPVLYRQRDRWQRGLIDILYFHRAMQANPRYGRIGLVSMPYYFLFELLGPFLEIQGYIMVAIAFFLGLLDINLVLLLFISAVLLGMLVSIFALAIVAKENDYFPGPYMKTMLVYAFLENFGVRQMIGFWRVTGFFSSLRQTVDWGNMERKGFRPKVDGAIRGESSAQES
jgi:cellulose synthase/poly-beta-1,6-N-acetylglucosamine synthase-like glycosyltransferase